MLRNRTHDERGATAIMVGILSLVLFGMGALAVDLGNAFSRKGDTQAQADFAALAGAAELPAAKDAADPMVLAVAQYFIDNIPRDDNSSSVPTLTAMATALVNGSNVDGEVYPDDDELRVVSPQATVNFGLAHVFGDAYDGVEVASEATAMMGTPSGNAVLPMYVANPTPGNPGCDYGLQTLTDPPGGHVVPPAVPTLAYDTHENGNDLDDITVYDNGSPATTIALDSTTASITIGGDFTNATRVGFFRSDDTSTTAVVEVLRSTWTSPVGSTPYSANNGAITVSVPASVTAVDQLWYVRVYQGGSGSSADKWSDKDEAQAVSVGDAPYECVGGSEDGNFGTLKMPRSTNNTATSDGWIARNIALGLESPLSLEVFPGSPPPWTCSASVTGAVISDSTTNRNPGTNCLDTDTGMTHSTATPGFILGKTGTGAYSGLLEATTSSEDPDGNGGCSPSGDTSTVTLLGKTLNNDVLSCFLTDTTTTLSTVARRTYTGGVKFHQEIYESPRFSWVPVFKQEVVSGGSQKYSIVDFRPAFITDESMASTKGSSVDSSAATVNGLGVTGSGSSGRLETIKVVFININALPDGAADTPIGPYLGVGPIAIRLID